MKSLSLYVSNIQKIISQQITQNKTKGTTKETGTGTELKLNVNISIDSILDLNL